MEFTLKDLVYIGIYVATVTGLIAKFRYRISRVEDSTRTINRVVFMERGGLNVITKVECEKSQANLRQHSQDALNQISIINQNIVKIMMDMNLEPIPMKPETLTKS